MTQRKQVTQAQTDDAGNISREHKSRLFCFLFGREENRRWTLSLYNGLTETEDDVTLRLSDAFLAELEQGIRSQNSLGEIGNTPIDNEQVKEQALKLLEQIHPDIEVTVRMLNINAGHNKQLMEACKPLREYAWFVAKIREHGHDMEIGAAVDVALADMPKDYEIRPFLIGHQAEVKNMCLTEYDEEKTMEMFKEEFLEEGINRGRQLGISEGISQGELNMLYTLVHDGLLPLKDALPKTNLTKETFIKNMKEYVALNTPL